MSAADFLLLAETGELHPGVVVFRRGGLSREEQWRWLEPVVRSLLDDEGSTVNRAILVSGPGRFTVLVIPPAR